MLLSAECQAFRPRKLSCSAAASSAPTPRAWRWAWAHVGILDVSLRRLNELDLQFGAMLNTVFSTIDSIEEHVVGADLVIGGVLTAEAEALITRKMVSR